MQDDLLRIIHSLYEFKSLNFSTVIVFDEVRESEGHWCSIRTAMDHNNGKIEPYIRYEVGTYCNALSLKINSNIIRYQTPTEFKTYKFNKITVPEDLQIDLLKGKFTKSDVELIQFIIKLAYDTKL